MTINEIKKFVAAERGGILKDYRYWIVNTKDLLVMRMSNSIYDIITHNTQFLENKAIKHIVVDTKTMRALD